MGLRRVHDREQFPPRLIRFRAAPAYLGMNKNLFNQLVRPCVSVIPLGKRAIAFDRLELDNWAEQYCQRYGRPALRKEGQLYRNEEFQDSRSASASMVRSSGTLTNVSKDSDAFARALERAMKRKPQGI